MSMGMPLETIEIENRVLGHSEGSPVPDMGKFPPSVENYKLFELIEDYKTIDLTLLYPFGSILVLILYLPA